MDRLTDKLNYNANVQLSLKNRGRKKITIEDNRNDRKIRNLDKNIYVICMVDHKTAAKKEVVYWMFLDKNIFTKKISNLS